LSRSGRLRVRVAMPFSVLSSRSVMSSLLAGDGGS
jgi:hypothetical protein